MVFNNKVIIIVFMFLGLTSFPVSANTIENRYWAECEQEMEQKEFPRGCMVVAVKAKKMGFMAFYTKIQRYCLEHIELWLPLALPDQIILNQYYPECAYRYSNLSDNSEEPLKISDVKEEMVRFLYMNATNDGSNTNSKKLSDTLTTWTGPK